MSKASESKLFNYSVVKVNRGPLAIEYYFNHPLLFIDGAGQRVDSGPTMVPFGVVAKRVTSVEPLSANIAAIGF